MQSNTWIVCKFGGSSLADATQIRKATDIVLSNPHRRVMVVSAPGKRHPDDQKITDMLIQIAEAGQTHDPTELIDRVAERYRGIAEGLGLERDYTSIVSDDLLDRLHHTRGQSAQVRNDRLKAAGEDLNARLIADYLNHIGTPARYVSPAEAGLHLHREAAGQVRIDEDTYANLAELRHHDELMIFPGFFGVDQAGEVITFSRGGSDITGSILAAALHARVYENWTDVDSVFSANPTIIPSPHAIKEMTYTEMRELAYAGFSVLHEEALEPVYNEDIPLEIRNTNNPSSRGTRIVSERKDYDGIITGVAGSRGFVAIRLHKYLMNREIGFAARVLQIFTDFQVPLDHIPTGIDSLSVVTRESYFSPAREAQVVRALKDQLGLTEDEIHVQRGIAMVVIVGDALPQTVGLLSRALVAFREGGINLEFIVQAAGEISVLFGIKEEFCNYAIQLLYKTYFSHLKE